MYEHGQKSEIMNPLRGLRKFWGFGFATIMEPLRGSGFFQPTKILKKVNLTEEIEKRINNFFSHEFQLCK